MVLFIASLPQDEYQIAVKIFEKFELCQVKDQGLSRTQRAAIRVSKLDCKGGYFKPLRGMDPTARKELLQEISDGDMSFNELASSCKYAKKMRDIQTAFMRYLDLPSWGAATEKYPDYTRKERLEPFLTSSFKKGTIPPSFTSFCQLAKQSSASSDNGSSTIDSDLKAITVGRVIGLLLNKDVLEIETDLLLSSMRSHGFCGFNLAIIDPPKVCTNKCNQNNANDLIIFFAGVDFR